MIVDPQDWGRFGVSLIADALDALGHREQVIDRSLAVRATGSTPFVAGPARTLLLRSVPASESGTLPPVEKTVAMLREHEDWVRPGSVMVFGIEDAVVPAVGHVGGLYGRMYKSRGVVGLLSAGYVRDIDEMRSIGLTVMAAGVCATNGRGRVRIAAKEQPIHVGGVLIHDGDIVAIDGDGAVIVPQRVAHGEELSAWLVDAHRRELDAIAILDAGGRLSDAFARAGRL